MEDEDKFILKDDNIDRKEEESSFSSEQEFKQLAIPEDPPVQITEEEAKKLKEAEDAVTKQKSTKKKLISFAGMVLNIVIVAVILVVQLNTGESVISLGELFSSNFSWGCLVLCFLFFILENATTSVRFQIIIYNTTKKNRPALAYKASAVGRYYDCITPLATGGQPFQIYYMNKRGVDGSSALSVSLGYYCIHQLIFVVMGVILMFCSIPMMASDPSILGAVVSTGSWIGISLNFILIAIVFLVSVSRRIGTRMVEGTLKFLQKIKIVKNYENQYTRVMKFAEDYQSTMKKYATSKFTLLGLSLLSILNLLIHYSIPFLVYCTLSGGLQMDMWWEIVLKCVMVDLASSFIPLPGGTGAAELSFTALFGAMFAGGRLFWALLFWRILSYYGFIAQGLLIQIYDFFRGNKKYEWIQKKWQLEAESEEFKTEQIQAFEDSLNKNQKKKKSTRKNQNNNLS